MIRRLAIPLALLSLALVVALVPALRGEAQEGSSVPEIEEVSLSAEPGPVEEEPDPVEEPDPAEAPEAAEVPEASASEWQEVAVDANLVAIEWTGDPAAEFTIEVHGGDGQWRVAGAIEHHDNGPDPGTPEGDADAAQPPTNVSEPLWTDDVAAVRVRLAAGTADEVKLVAIDSPPVADPAPEQAQQANLLAGGLLAAAAVGVVVSFVSGRRRLVALGVLVAVVAVACVPVKNAGPGAGAAIPSSIISRASWGSDLPWNSGGSGCDESKPKIASGVGRAIVHHTVNSNGYTPQQSVQIIRGIWSHHTQVNGWCDIGYNFLIDRFSRVYEGRRGGIDKAVVGAHAAGANTGSTGIAFIGDHRSTPVPSESQGSIINLIVWKFRVHDTNPIPGSIVGHLQVNSTECPGAKAVELLPRFRDEVRKRLP